MGREAVGSMVLGMRGAWCLELGVRRVLGWSGDDQNMVGYGRACVYGVVL